MDGVFVIKKENIDNTGSSSLPVLLVKSDGVEVMVHNITADSTIWITPADGVMEFYMILTGALSLTLDDEQVVLSDGESFYVNGLKNEIFLRALRDTQLLSLNNGALYDDIVDFHDDLETLLKNINDKDHITYAHSRNVMECSIKLFQALKLEEQRLSTDEMITAALFHDVGKCNMPDEVLLKKGSLTPYESRFIIKHPTHSARLLKPRFGSKVAEIAQNHHERLDGSGYPYGLSGDEISFEAKIVAVADVFDAMTSERGYNKVKDPLTAANELCSLSKLFEPTITAALLKLVLEGAFDDKQVVNTSN
ncbi:MAG: HD domain-containing phosphohydrolase [Bacillota bacterium]|nr:HD domain-containing phosphohydrolase [Bacillota bacterium]